MNAMQKTLFYYLNKKISGKYPKNHALYKEPPFEEQLTKSNRTNFILFIIFYYKFYLRSYNENIIKFKQYEKQNSFIRILNYFLLKNK